MYRSSETRRLQSSSHVRWISVTICLFAVLAMSAAVSSAQSSTQSGLAAPYVDGRLVIKMKEGVGPQERAQIETDLGATTIRRFSRSGAEVWAISGVSVEEAVATYRKHPSVEYAEPDYIAFELAIPNDPLFSLQWGLHNTGQSGGTADADVDAPEAWDLETGDDVVIAVFDTGTDYTHPDLAPNLWTNPGEIAGNGLDDDGNGFVDDVHGYDFINDDGDPMDDRFHGTHVAGIAAARGNDGVGIAGVNWSAKIMILKFLGADGFGSYTDAAAALEYATTMGVRLSNHSWGGCGFSQLLLDEIEEARAAGHLVVAGAGNGNCPPFDGGDDNDVTPFYPASYDLDNIIAVAATDHNDDRPDFSNFGATSVDLGAPGVDVFSAFLPGVDFDGTYVCSDTDGDRYGYCTGTSMSTPFVAGTAALLWAAHPGLDYLQVRSFILNSVDPVPSMQGITVTGGRLNAAGALAAASSNQPPVAVDDFYTMQPDTNISIFYNDLLANDYDPDGDPVSFWGFDQTPPNGTICGIGPTGFCYRPDPGFTGEVIIEYTITDGSLQGSGDIHIDVNAPPVAVDDFYTVDAGTSVDIFYAALLANDYDPDGDPVSFVGFGPIPSGTICGVGPTGFCFRPDGCDDVAIPYTITDGHSQATGYIRITVPPLFADNFDSGNLSSWDAVITTGSGSIGAQAKAAILGPFGMVATVDGAGTSAWLRDNSPASETSYRASFYLSLAGIKQFLDGNQHNILVARDDSPSQWVVLLAMRRSGSNYQVRARTRLDNGSVVNTPWVVLSQFARAHRIEVVWDGADPGLSNGGLEFSVNGTLEKLTALDNDAYQIDHVRFGMVSGIDAGTKGDYIFDEFESCRD